MGTDRNKSGSHGESTAGQVGKRVGRSAPWLSGKPSERRSLSSPWDQVTVTAIENSAEHLTESQPDPFVHWQIQKLESLGLMAGGVARDFNNSLLAILGKSDLLVRTLDADSIEHQILTEIQAEAKRAGDLCQQLLAFAGEGQFQIKPLDLSATVRAMVGILKVGVSRRITLRLELATELPPIEADIAQVQQVVMNLVVNAAEAIGDSSGVITLRSELRSAKHCKLNQCVVAPSGAADSYLVLEVVDSGVGMDGVTKARAFDPFYSTKTQGRGLGLASVLGIVRSHCGGVRVESCRGRGSTVTILFPFCQNIAARKMKRPAWSPAESSRRILVVDDEEYLRILSARMLRRLGYQVYLAQSGREALAICEQQWQKLDCVLLDLVMPEMDGGEVQAELRRRYPALKVLLTSGYHELDIRHRFAGCGLAGFLQRPFSVEQLGRKLNEVINQPEAAPPLAGLPD